MRKDLSWIDVVFVAGPLVLMLVLLVYSKTPSAPTPIEPLPPLVAETYKYEIVFDERITKDEVKQFVEFATNSMDEISVENKEKNIWKLNIKTVRYPSVVEKQLQSCPLVKTLTRIEE